MDQSVTYVDKNENEVQLFAKSNELISAKYESTLLEDKILTAALKNIKKDGKRIYAVLYANELRDAFGGNSGSFYTLLRQSTINMGSRFLLKENSEKEEFEFINLISNAIYKDGKYTIEFNNRAEKDLIDLQKNYTLLNAKIIYKIKSRITLKLYENLESKCYIGKREKERYHLDTNKYIIPYNISELKFILGAVDMHNASIAFLFTTNSNEDDWDEKMARVIEIAAKEKNEKVKKAITPKWPVWKDFNKVLQKAVDELNEVSNMNIVYTPLKKSRTVTGVSFEVTYKDIEELREMADKKPEEAVNEPSKEEIFSMMDDIQSVTGSDFTLSEIDTLITESKYNVELIKKQYKNYLYSKKRNDIPEKGKMGWMISAIRKDYDVSPAQETKKNDFKNFEQSTYDWDEINKELGIN